MVVLATFGLALQLSVMRMTEPIETIETTEEIGMVEALESQFQNPTARCRSHR